MKRIGLAVVLASLACALGCGSKSGVVIDDDECAWGTAPGPWVDEWNEKHSEVADQYLWMVGISEPVSSKASLQHARRSAEDHAIDGLVAKLGINVNTMQLTGQDWTNETRQLVIGLYKQALKTQMADHKVNLSPYLWCDEEKEDTTVVTGRSYVAQGLFRLDKAMLTQSLAEDTAKDFEEKVKQHRELTTKAQREAVERAKELTKRWSESMMSPQGE